MITSGERQLLLPKTMVLFAMLRSMQIFDVQKSWSIFSISIVPRWILSSLWFINIYIYSDRKKQHPQNTTERYSNPKMSQNWNGAFL